MRADDLSGALRCLRCSGLLKRTRSAWSCASCGTEVPMTFDVVDFLVDKPRLSAANGAVDLAADYRQAQDLMAVWHGSSFSGLQQLLGASESGGACSSPSREAAHGRFARKYGRVAAEVGLAHGAAILSKVDAHLTSMNESSIRGRWCLEAAGGHGLFLVDFAERFENLVFVDCSLSHILLAKKLMEERSIDNVAFVRADVTELPFVSGRFDFVHENGIIEHVADPQRMIDEGLRVCSSDGIFVCLSPNRFTIAPEPHFRIPVFGFIPQAIRRKLLPRARGLTSEAGTELRSLRELRSYLRSARDASIFFLPRGLQSTARRTTLRRMVHFLLAGRWTGRLVAWFLNGPLLPVMPYHIAVVPGRGRP